MTYEMFILQGVEEMCFVSFGQSCPRTFSEDNFSFGSFPGNPGKRHPVDKEKHQEPMGCFFR